MQIDLRRHLWLITFAALLMGSTVVFADQTKKGSDIQFYGFLRMDAAYDSSRLSDTQVPAYVLSEDPKALAAKGVKAAPENQDEFTLYTRMTRLGFNLTGAKVKGMGAPKLTGRMEVDFYGPASDSRNMFRMRHAWLKLQWGDFSVLAGQTVDLISPLYPIANDDMILWGAGNLADRRPQARLQYALPIGESHLFLQGAAGLTSAIDRKDLDGNGVPDGEVSGRPTLQGRAAYRMPVWNTNSPLEVGVWAHQAWEELDSPIAEGGETEFQSNVVGVDVKLPIYQDRLALSAEGWTGKNLSDVRGGIFQGINPETNAEINAMGGFAQLSATVIKKQNYKNVIFLGASVDNPEDEDLSNGSRSLNRVFFIVQQSSFGPVVINLEYLNWTTEYKGFEDGTSDRVRLYAAYKF